MKLVSIIVPVYKAENYLTECLESIIKQTYTRIEVILVDDGSPDNSGAICDEYKKKDDRIKVIHQSNMGVVGARNVGFSQVKGEYICFVDADDVLSPYYVKTMAEAMDREYADLAVCNYVTKKEDLFWEKQDNYEEKLITDRDLMLDIIVRGPKAKEYSRTGDFVWDKMFRRELILEGYKNDCTMCEDLRFNFEYIRSCGRMVIIPMPLYYFRENDEGICAVYKRNHPRDVMHLYQLALLWKAISFTRVMDEGLDQYLKSRTVRQLYIAVDKIYMSKLSSKFETFLDESREYIKKNYLSLWKVQGKYGTKIKMTIAAYCYLFPIWLCIERKKGRDLRREEEAKKIEKEEAMYNAEVEYDPEVEE